MLLQDEPQHWVGGVTMTLLSELRRRAPHSIDWSPLQDIMSMLDAVQDGRVD